jgi:predicted nucleotidyltransferase
MKIRILNPIFHGNLFWDCLSKDISDIVRKFAAIVAARGIHVEKILVYGSYASNRQRDDSDLDVAIISPDFGKDRLDEGVMLNKLAWRVDARLHPVPFSTEAFLYDSWVPLIHEIRTNGIEIQ